MSLQESPRKSRREWGTVAGEVLKRVKVRRHAIFARLTQPTEEKLYTLSHPDELRGARH